MDKQKTITIKINGKDRLYKQDQEKNEENKRKETREEQGTKGPKVVAWNETAAAQESTDDQFDWVLPDPLPEETSKPKESKQRGFRLPAINKQIPPHKKNKKTPGVLPRILLNVSLAVIVGLGFGLIILNTVTSDEKQEALPSVATPGAETPSGTGSSTETVEIPSISTFVVQGGVFTTKESAESAVQSLSANGIHAQEVASGDKFALLLATAGSIDQAKEASATLESKGAEVFAKPFELSGGNVQGLTKAESEVIKLAPTLYQLLSTGNTSNSDSVSQVENQLASLKKIDEKQLKSQNLILVKNSLEKGAAAFSAKKNAEIQKETLAFLAAWQSLGK